MNSRKRKRYQFDTDIDCEKTPNSSIKRTRYNHDYDMRHKYDYDMRYDLIEDKPIESYGRYWEKLVKLERQYCVDKCVEELESILKAHNKHNGHYSNREWQIIDYQEEISYNIQQTISLINIKTRNTFKPGDEVSLLCTDHLDLNYNPQRNYKENARQLIFEDCIHGTIKSFNYKQNKVIIKINEFNETLQKFSQNEYHVYYHNQSKCKWYILGNMNFITFKKLFENIDRFIHKPHWFKYILSADLSYNKPYLISGKQISDKLRISSQLNDSQRKAAIKAIKYPISLIQGPPGTGKTYTAANTVKYLMDNKRNTSMFDSYVKPLINALKTYGYPEDIISAIIPYIYVLEDEIFLANGIILLSAHTNAATDQMLESTLQLSPEFKNKVVRFGRNSLKIKSEFSDISLNYLIKQHNNYDELVDIRRAAHIARREGNKKRQKELTDSARKMVKGIVFDIFEQRPIVAATAFSVCSDMFVNVPIRHVITDESTQMTEPELLGIIALNPLQLTMIGDLNQLSTVVRNDAIKNKFGRTLYERLQNQISLPLAFNTNGSDVDNSEFLIENMLYFAKQNGYIIKTNNVSHVLIKNKDTKIEYKVCIIIKCLKIYIQLKGHGSGGNYYFKNEFYQIIKNPHNYFNCRKTNCLYKMIDLQKQSNSINGSGSGIKHICSYNNFQCLNIQYRSFPLLMEFSNIKFYNQQIKSDKQFDKQLLIKGWNWFNEKPLNFISINGRECKTGTSWSNIEESRLISDIVVNLIDVTYEEIGIICMYKQQTKQIRQDLSTKIDWKELIKIDISTVDAFQGKEKSIILISMVRTNVSTYLNNYRRANVALTRSKLGTIVVGNGNSLQKSDGIWNQFVKFCQSKQLVNDRLM